MRKLLTSKWFIVTLTVLLLAAFIVTGFLPNSPLRSVLKPVGAVVSPVQTFIKSCGSKLSDFWTAIDDGVAIRQENVELRERIAELEYQNAQNEEASIRYQELRDAFHIRDTFSNYDIFGAPVLSREADEWFSVIRVGSGTVDGLTMEDGSSLAVVDSSMSLVGRVIEVGTSETRILPLIHEGFSVSCKVNVVNGASLTVSGDSSLKNDGLCLVSNFDSDVELEPGTVIVTSGNGGLFPEGIPVGEIVSVDYSNPLDCTATLRPYASIEDINDVFILAPNAEISSEVLETEAGED